MARRTTSCPTGTIIAPPRPCRIRPATKTPKPGLAAQSTEANVNSTIAVQNTRRAPNRETSHPPTGMNVATVIR